MPKKYKPSEYMDLIKRLILENYLDEKFDSKLQLNGMTKLSEGELIPVILSWEDIYYIKTKGENNRIEFKWGIIKEMGFDTKSIDTIEDLVNFVPTMNIYGFFHREDFYEKKVAKVFMQTNNFKEINLFSSDIPFSEISVNKLPIEEALKKIIRAEGYIFG